MAKFGDLMSCGSKDITCFMYYLFYVSWRHRFGKTRDGWKTKTWISREWNITFLQNKKILNMCLRWHILRGNFVVEVTFSFFLIYAPFDS